MIETIVESWCIEVSLLSLSENVGPGGSAYLDAVRVQVVPSPAGIAKVSPLIKDAGAASAIVQAIGIGATTKASAAYHASVSNHFINVSSDNARW